MSHAYEQKEYKERVSRKENPRNKVVYFRLSVNEFIKVNELSRKRGKTKSAVIRDCFLFGLESIPLR